MHNKEDKKRKERADALTITRKHMKSKLKCKVCRKYKAFFSNINTGSGLMKGLPSALSQPITVNYHKKWQLYSRAQEKTLTFHTN